MFTRAPSDAEWQAQLAGQAHLTVSGNDALQTVREAWQQSVEAADGKEEMAPHTRINDE
jgi:hypothetical protein